MPRPTIYEKAHRVNVMLEHAVFRSGSRKAFELGFSGGFSEYVARLLTADLRRKKSAAIRSSRYLGGA